MINGHGPGWHVVRAERFAERHALAAIAELALETYLPLETHFARHGRQVRRVSLPLFRGYLFTRFDVAHDPWGAIRNARADCSHSEPCETMLVGYSHERQRLEHWLLPGHDGYEAEGIAAWALTHRTGNVYLAPAPDGLTLECDARTFDPYTDGVALMEAQRRTKVEISPGVRGHGVGVFVQLTTVTARGVASGRMLRVKICGAPLTCIHHQS